MLDQGRPSSRNEYFTRNAALRHMQANRGSQISRRVEKKALQLQQHTGRQTKKQIKMSQLKR